MIVPFPFAMPGPSLFRRGVILRVMDFQVVVAGVAVLEPVYMLRIGGI